MKRTSKVKTLTERTTKKGSPYYIVETESGGKAFCWDTSLMAGVKVGDEVILELSERSQNGNMVYDVKSCTKPQPVASNDGFVEDDGDGDIGDYFDEPVEFLDELDAASQFDASSKEEVSETSSESTAGVKQITKFESDDVSSDNNPNLALYRRVANVPENAKKPITGGRLNGMTNINPMCRIKTMTAEFGPYGKGWYYDVVRCVLVDSQGKIADMLHPELTLGVEMKGEITVFTTIQLFYMIDGEWSKPVIGQGGSKFIASEKSGLYMSDEAMKCAETDALGQACKKLGVGASVYWIADADNKYE